MKITNQVEKISSKHNKWTVTESKQINLFVGPNNSGKSREIRELFSCDQLLLQIAGLSSETVLREAVESHSDWTYHTGLSNQGKTALLQNINKMLQNTHLVALSDLSEQMSTLPSDDVWRVKQFIEKSILEPLFTRNEHYDEAWRLFKLEWSKVYIPTLRSLRHIDSEDKYHNRTLKDYFTNSLSESHSIFTGHSLYEDLKAHLLGSHEQREKVSKYEEYLSRSFFFGQPISIVPRVGKDVVFFKEGDKKERAIFDLGDGIQSIIMLTFPVFMAEKPTMFFIEEPEHYLHAGLQRTLIETLANFEEHMFFMTTHSNHFLDMAQERDDISVQHVRREGEETIISPSTKHAELLTDLGVRASSVLLANCSIWVEGITDKLYLRTYLEKYLQELKSIDSEREAKLRSYHENLHYVFTEYQGSNITHWGFDEDVESDSQTPARKLSNNIMLIADADIKTKGERVDLLKDALGDNFYLLDWKEIENYIPHNILVDTAKKRWETFNTKHNCSISRFANIPEGHFEHSNRGIGLILEGFVDSPEPDKRSFFRDKSGTIKDKVKFCRTAVEIMNNPETQWELTPQLNDLCEKIWDFIEKHN